jgi:hypothetical protein
LLQKRGAFGFPFSFGGRVQIETCVNTSDEVLFGNVLVNSKRPIKWVKDTPKHEGQAVLVGGGPSVTDWIEEIRWRQSLGQTIFALNNAAQMLASHGITADYTVIVDARELNASFIGYSKHYLLASQCHPKVFDGLSNVTLWHQQYPDNMDQFDACLPAYEDEYALIGGGTTVGLSAMCLAYVMGFRNLHLYGYDSSYRNGSSHAYPQFDPQGVTCNVTVAGKTFTSTLAMAQQAQFFPQMSDLLIDEGCLLTIRGDGLLPWTSQQAAKKEPEREVLAEDEKYRRMWAFPDYRKVSPGEMVADRFVQVAGVTNKTKVIDFGCGTGRGSKRIHELTKCPLQMVDFADNCLDAGVDFTFTPADLTKPIHVKGDIGFCADVMEHIPTEDVKDVIKNVMACVPKCFFQISLVPDYMGGLIGHPLHLTVKPFAWWQDLFKRLGYSVEFSDDHGDAALFHISTT